MLFVFSHVEYCDMCLDFAMALHMLLLTNTKGVFPTEGFRLGVYFLVFTRQCVRLVFFSSVAVQSEKEVVQLINTQGNILEMVQRSRRLSTRRTASRIGVSRTQVWRTIHEENLHPYHDHRVKHLEPGDSAQRMDLCQWITAHSQLLRYFIYRLLPGTV